MELSVFPGATFVKKIALVGKFSTLKNWQWNLILTVEEPPPVEVFSDKSLPVAALDLGYRQFDDYIRFGFVVDSDGNKFELRLPTGNMMSAYLKNTIKFLAKKGVEKQYIRDLKDYFAWDAAQGASLEVTKAQLKSVSEAAEKQGIEMPEEWREIFKGFVKVRNRGLLKLKRVSNEILEGAGEITETARNLLKQTIEILEKWQAANTYFETEKEHFRRKFIGRRKLLFRQTVKWLASNYSLLVWKGVLDLKEIAAQAKKSSRLTDAALKESNKFRQWTGLYQLRLFVREQSSKKPGWLRAAETPAYPPTQSCEECGAEIVSPPSKLMLVCANGHEKDRDE